MADGLVNMGQQFGTLPMESLIGGPLIAAAQANQMMVGTNAKFIMDIGFKKDSSGKTTGEANMVEFGWEQQNVEKVDGKDVVTPKQMKVKVPMLAIVPLPGLKVKEVNVNFSMQVNSSTEDTSESSSELGVEGSGRIGYGPFSVGVKVHGKTSSHSSQTRKSDNSAKLDISVVAEDGGITEGLARVLDMMHDAISPSQVPASAPANE